MASNHDVAVHALAIGGLSLPPDSSEQFYSISFGAVATATDLLDGSVRRDATRSRRVTIQVTCDPGGEPHALIESLRQRQQVADAVAGPTTAPRFSFTAITVGGQSVSGLCFLSQPAEISIQRAAQDRTYTFEGEWVAITPVVPQVVVPM